MSVPSVIESWRAAMLVASALALVATAVPPSAHAAVAISQSDPDDAPTITIVGTIVDDPDPIYGVWHATRPDSDRWRSLNSGGDVNGDGPPSVVRDPLTAAPIVAWSRNNADSTRDIVVSRFEAGAWSDPEIVVAGGELHDPSLAVDPDTGLLHLVFWAEGAAPKVLHATSAGGAGSWSAPQQLSLPGEIALRPHAVLDGATLRVVYEVHDAGRDATPRRIEIVHLDGVSPVREVVAYSPHDEAHWPRVHARGGRVWVDWIDDAGRMAWRRHVDGGWDPVRVEPFDGLEQREFHVRPSIAREALD